MARERRIDFAGPMEPASTLADGSIEITGYIARIGVQVYRYTDGTTVREYRPPSEVFADSALESFDDLALVVGHPDNAVTPENWSALAKGHVDDPRKDGNFVAAECVVKDAATIKAIADGELIELSCGYFCVVDATPGVTPEGEAYDQIQRSIIGNHVALGPKGWARAGEDVRLYGGDSATAERTACATYPIRMLAPRTDTTAAIPAAVAPATQVEVIPRSEYDRVCAERDTAIASATASTASATAAIAGADSKLADRVRLHVAALKADSSIVLAGKSDRDIMVAIITKSDSAFKVEGKSDEYLRARFDLLCEGALPAADRPQTQALADQVANATSETVRADDGNSAVNAREKMLARQRDRSNGIKGSK